MHFIYLKAIKDHAVLFACLHCDLTIDFKLSCQQLPIVGACFQRGHQFIGELTANGRVMVGSCCTCPEGQSVILVTRLQTTVSEPCSS